ncbi:MAG: hypothetical protein ACLGIA_02040 [Actinomycetes bacterium]
MTIALLAGFLLAHGLLHLAIWLPRPAPDPDRPPPFEPDHSAVLAATAVPQATAHQLSVGLAAGSAATYLLAGVGVALAATWAVPIAAAAALLGLALKALFFSPWLSVGVLLDVAVLSSALLGWPVVLA